MHDEVVLHLEEILHQKIRCEHLCVEHLQKTLVLRRERNEVRHLLNNSLEWEDQVLSISVVASTAAVIATSAANSLYPVAAHRKENSIKVTN